MSISAQQAIAADRERTRCRFATDAAFGRRYFTPFGRGGRLTYSGEVLRGSRIAGRWND
jgi:hypothetical protein